MSAKATAHVWELDLDKNEMVVAQAFADHADHEGRNMKPSIGLVAWKTGYSPRNVKRVVASLLTKGIFKVQAFESGGRVTYLLDFGAGVKKQPYRYNRLTRSQVKAFIRDRIAEIGPRCQFCGDAGNNVVGPDGKPWTAAKFITSDREEIDNLVLSCAHCFSIRENGELPVTIWHRGQFDTGAKRDTNSVQVVQKDALSVPNTVLDVTQTVSESPSEPLREPSLSSDGETPPPALISPSDLVPDRMEIVLTDKREKVWIKSEFANDMAWLKAWMDWCRFMGKKGRSLKAEQAQRYFDMFENYPVESVTMAIEKSVQSGYTQIYEDRIKKHADQLLRIAQEAVQKEAAKAQPMQDEPVVLSPEQQEELNAVRNQFRERFAMATTGKSMEGVK